MFDVMVTIIAVVSFVAALPQVWGSNWKDIISLYRYGIVSWRVVHSSAVELATYLSDKELMPTIIVSVGRGGTIASGLILSEITRIQFNNSPNNIDIETPSIRMGIINTKITLKKTKHNHSTRHSLVDDISYSFDNINSKIQNDDLVLLVVAQNFTGSSLRQSLITIEKFGVPRSHIITCALFWHRDKAIACNHVPDIVGKVVSKTKTMPWKDSKNNTDRH